MSFFQYGSWLGFEPWFQKKSRSSKTGSPGEEDVDEAHVSVEEEPSQNRHQLLSPPTVIGKTNLMTARHLLVELISPQKIQTPMHAPVAVAAKEDISHSLISKQPLLDETTTSTTKLTCPQFQGNWNIVQTRIKTIDMGRNQTFDIENMETTPNISEVFSDQTKPPLRSWKRLLRNSNSSSSKDFEISNSTPCDN